MSGHPNVQNDVVSGQRSNPHKAIHEYETNSQFCSGTPT
ncbi:MAG: hypothetical protein JWP79_2870 [Polaromonas sp.]|jgi:hypothetical protein|nr:hypothetical protein [Polaromonas sp.]MDB5938680.1 hypothetical protein [Polaromonas sp.]